MTPKPSKAASSAFFAWCLFLCCFFFFGGNRFGHNQGHSAVLFAGAQRGAWGYPCSESEACPVGYYCDFHYRTSNSNITYSSSDVDSDNDNKNATTTPTTVQRRHPGGLCRGCDSDCAHLLWQHNDEARADCLKRCDEMSNACSREKPCGEGLFCNFLNETAGVCTGCPSHVYFCHHSNLTTNVAEAECASSCHRVCHRKSTAVIDNVRYDANALLWSPTLLASGPLVDCERGLSTCSGANNSVCLIERGVADFYEKVRNCEAGGGVGAIIYNTEDDCILFGGTLAGEETFIPSVSVSHGDGKHLLKSGSGLQASISVFSGEESCNYECSDEYPCTGENFTCNFDLSTHGDCKECYPTVENNFCRATCNAHTPCEGQGLFCNYEVGLEGECVECPSEVGSNCFYSGLTREGAEECSAVCGGGSELTFSSCKFCPHGVSVRDFGEGSISEKGGNLCEFCGQTRLCGRVSRWDMKYPNRTVPAFGDGASCWIVAEFIRDMEIDANSAACRLARNFNYICGCDGPGYAGANTDAKRNALIWVPRVSALLSFIVSSVLSWRFSVITADTNLICLLLTYRDPLP